MKRFLILIVGPLLLACPAPTAGAEALRVVVGTSLVEDIVRDLAAGRVTLVTLTPGSSYPGHNDLKATDAAFAASADVALVHEFQAKIPQVKRMLAAANRHLRMEALAIRGSWTIPSIQEVTTRRIGQILTAARPQWAADIHHRTASRLARIAVAEAHADLNPDKALRPAPASRGGTGASPPADRHLPRDHVGGGVAVHFTHRKEPHEWTPSKALRC